MFSKNILFKNFQFKRNIRDIKNCEGLALVINEESMHTVVDKIVRFTAKVESKEIDMNNIYKMMQ